MYSQSESCVLYDCLSHGYHMDHGCIYMYCNSLVRPKFMLDWSAVQVPPSTLFLRLEYFKCITAILNCNLKPLFSREKNTGSHGKLHCTQWKHVSNLQILY